MAEEHSEKYETEGREEGDSDNEKDPEHKATADLDEVGPSTTQRPSAITGSSMQSIGLTSSEPKSNDPAAGGSGRAGAEEMVGPGGGEPPPTDYGAIKDNIPATKQITLDELLDQMGFRCYHYIVIIILSIVTIADVMETEVGILLGPTLLCEWKLTALVGSLIWGTIADKYGRKDTLIVMLLWIGVFGVCTSFSNSLVPYVILRLFTGVGVGGAFLPVTFATEMVNAKSRSFATLIIFFAAFIGTILASTLAMFILPLNNGWKWYIIASSLLVIVSSFFVAAFVPESPRFLLLTGNHEGVIRVLRRFDKSLDEETYHYLEPADMSNDRRGAVIELCKYKTRCIQFFVIAASWFLVKFNAMGIVLLYFERLQDKELTSNCGDNHGIVKTSLMTKIDKCEAMGFDEYLKITIFNLEVGFGAIISYIAAECLGRIRGMMLTNAVSVVFAMPLLLCMGEIVLTVIVMISKSFSAASWYIMTLYINEYFPTYIRSVGSGALDVFGRFGVIITPFIAQFLSKETMLGATILYIVTMLMALILTFFMRYETKDKVQLDNKSRNSQDGSPEEDEVVPIKGPTKEGANEKPAEKKVKEKEKTPEVEVSSEQK